MRVQNRASTTFPSSSPCARRPNHIFVVVFFSTSNSFDLSVYGVGVHFHLTLLLLLLSSSPPNISVVAKVSGTLCAPVEPGSGPTDGGLLTEMKIVNFVE